MQITLIRHGQIEGNIDRRYVGRTDQPLTETGIEQARAASALAPETDKLFVSPYIRCLQTASIVYPNTNQIVVDGLKEMDFGIFENKTAEEMENFKPYRDWVDTMCTGPVPDGESLGDFDSRVRETFERIVDGCDENDRISLVVHGGTIMSIMGAYNDEGRDYFEFHVSNCGMYICSLVRCASDVSTPNWDGSDIEDRPGFKLHRIDGADVKGTLPPK